MMMMMMMMMNAHLWAFSLLLILRHNDVGHYKEGVFVLKRKEKKKTINSSSC